jgi:cysteine desulfurase
MIHVMWNRRVYADYASATPVRKEALRAFSVAQESFPGNPHSLHLDGVRAHDALAGARKDIARAFECKDSEVLLVSGGTEGNNLALLGTVRHLLTSRTMTSLHIVVSATEHSSVLEPCRELERLGARVTYVYPNEQGIITDEAVASVLTPSTVFVSVHWANSETGIIQSIPAIARRIRAYEKEHGVNIVFHADAGQAPLYLAHTFSSLGCDLLTVDSGKLYGPRGCGAVLMKFRVQLAPLMYGGGQEKGLRPGTENVALAAGFAAALQSMASEREGEVRRLRDIRKRLIAALQAAHPDVVVHGTSQHTLPHMISVALPDSDAEYVVLRMDAQGVSVATKSACDEAKRESHVIQAMTRGTKHAWATLSTIRISLGKGTRRADVKRIVQAITDARAVGSIQK